MSYLIAENEKPRPDREPARKKGFTGKRRFRPGEWLIERGIQGAAVVCLLLIALIFAFVFREAAPIVTGQVPVVEHVSDVGQSESYGEESSEDVSASQRDLELQAEASDAKIDLPHILGKEWQPVSLDPRFGILPLLLGSVKVTLIALLFAAPIGVFAAVYTSSFAPKWSREFMKPVIEILAGIPSVVVGFFALIVLATLLQDLFGLEYRLNAFVGGVAMAIAVVPIIFTISEDALSAVPKSLTEASLAMGATKWETALRVVLPAATPGIFASILLGFGRAFGETMIVLMATGNAAMLTASFFEPVRTVSATIGAEMAEVVFGDPHYRMLFLLGALLFAVSFTLNAIAEFFVRHKLMKKFKGIG